MSQQIKRQIARWLVVVLASCVVSTHGLVPAYAGLPPVPPPPPPASAPAGLTATAGNARVTLAWSAVDGAAAYRIFRTAGAESATFSTSNRTYTDATAINGTVYSYRVAAYNKGGTGPSSAEAAALPLAPPTAFAATAGDRQVTLAWQAAAGAVTYGLYRSTSYAEETFVQIANVGAVGFVDTGLTNTTTYYYRVRTIASGGQSALSARVSAKPLPLPPASAPVNLTASPGNARVTLAWEAVDGATSYRLFRTTTDTFDATPIAKITTTTYKNTGLTNGTTYAYRVIARNDGGEGPPSAVVTARPVAPPIAPANLTAVPGDKQITLTWSAAPEAVTYNVYRGTRAGGQAKTPIVMGLSAPSFVDTTVENGPTYFYKITGLNPGGESPRSTEASATAEGPPLEIDPETTAAFRFLRMTTWGPRPGDVDHLKEVGRDAFLAEQFGAAPSIYPETLFAHSVETSQEHFMRLALEGPDQLRQRVAWALHKIWVVSAVEVPKASAIVTYYRILNEGAFGNYRDVMRSITLNPAMGRYLNMLNNRSQQITGVPPSENYARELMQLFVLGIPRVSPTGVPVLDETGAQVPAYSETDVKELARILSGWTFGDGNPATLPRRLAGENYKVPMEPVEAYHDRGAKEFLGVSFPAGQSAVQDLDQAMDVLFGHPNVGPFIGRQLIQQLVASNPSPGYVAAVAAAFDNNGGGVRGDLSAVVRAVLSHPEAQRTTPMSGKLSEPVMFIASMLRALNAQVVDHPFMSDKAEEMGQKVFYPPSVFSYFSPGYRVRGTVAPGTGAPLLGPEFQGLTSVTALVRANFVGSVLGRYFGNDVTVDYTPFTSRARDAAVLVDYCNVLFMGGRMSARERSEIIAAVRASSPDNVMERTRTALYLTLVIAQTQVDR